MQIDILKLMINFFQLFQGADMDDPEFFFLEDDDEDNGIDFMAVLWSRFFTFLFTILYLQNRCRYIFNLNCPRDHFY